LLFQSNPGSKFASLDKIFDPGFALTNHLHKNFISVRIDYCAETWSKWFIHSHLSKKSSDWQTQLSVKGIVVKSTIVIIKNWWNDGIRMFLQHDLPINQCWSLKSELSIPSQILSNHFWAFCFIIFWIFFSFLLMSILFYPINWNRVTP